MDDADRAEIIRGALIVAAMVLLCWAMTGCGPSEPPPRQEPTPAEDQAAHLRAIVPPAEDAAADLYRREVAAGLAAADAVAAGDGITADRHRQLAAEIGRLRAAAEQQAREQRAELDRRIATADRLAAAERLAAQRRAQDDAIAAAARAEEARDQALIRWSAIALAGAVVAAGLLLALRVPATVAVAIPAAVASGAVVLAAWLSVPWLPVALGCVLGLALLAGLVWLVRHLVREWTDYADRLGMVAPDAKAAADTASRASQPRVLRWLIDGLLRVAS